MVLTTTLESVEFCEHFVDIYAFYSEGFDTNENKNRTLNILAIVILQ